MSESFDVEKAPQDYRAFLKECLPAKKEEGIGPQEAMKACGIDWGEKKGDPVVTGGEVVSHDEADGLQGQLYLVGGDDCPACADAEEHFKADLESGVIKKVTIDDDEGWEIIRALELNEVPTLVLKKEDGSFCRVGEDGKIESCVIPKPAPSE